MSKCSIYISDYNKTKVLQFPTIPGELPEKSSDPKNEEFETYWDVPYNFIEKPGLLEFTLEGWLPQKASKYYFCKSNVNAKEIIDLIENAKNNVEPIRLVINTKEGYYANDTFSVESFKFNMLKRGDYKYSLKVKQWRDYSTIINTANTIGWKQDSTGWWYAYDENGSYYKGTWQLIDNEWYSFRPDGYAQQSAWLQDGGYWYYFRDNCMMIRNDWLQYEGKWYYFGSDGAMWFGGNATIDGVEYTFNDDGSLVE